MAPERPRKSPRRERMLAHLSSTPQEAAWKDGCVLGPSPGLSLSQPFTRLPPGGSLGLLSACSCCLCCSSPPSKALHQGTGKSGKDVFLPALPHLSHTPSTSYQCPPGATECAAPVLDSLQQPLCPRGFGKVGVSLSGGQLSGWVGRAVGEEACRVGDSWGDGDVSG